MGERNFSLHSIIINDLSNSNMKKWTLRIHSNSKLHLVCTKGPFKEYFTHEMDREFDKISDKKRHRDRMKWCHLLKFSLCFFPLQSNFPSVVSDGVLIISQCTSYVLRRWVSVWSTTEMCPLEMAAQNVKNLEEDTPSFCRTREK